MLNIYDLLDIAGLSTMISVSSTLVARAFPKKVVQQPPMISDGTLVGTIQRVSNLEQDHTWQKNIKTQELTDAIVELQNKVKVVEQRTEGPSVPGAIAVADLVMDKRIAELEYQFKWHDRTKHSELEQAFGRLENELNNLKHTQLKKEE